MTGRHKEIKSKDIRGDKKRPTDLLIWERSKNWAIKPCGHKGLRRRGDAFEKKGILPLLHTRRRLSKLAAFNGGRKKGLKAFLFQLNNGLRMVSVVAIAIHCLCFCCCCCSFSWSCVLKYGCIQSRSFSFPKEKYFAGLWTKSDLVFFLFFAACSMVLFLTLFGGCFQGYPCCNERGERGEGRWLCSFPTFNVDTFQRCPATPAVTRNF